MPRKIYDIETFPNLFCIGMVDAETGDNSTFEYSWRQNDIARLIWFLSQLKACDYQMVGFNNLGFDYPVLHFILEHRQQFEAGILSPVDIYHRATALINVDWNRRFDNIIWDRDQHIPQIDLFKIHHFDNPARMTSLKVLEFNMKRPRVVDLPFEPGTVLNSEQCDIVIDYMWDDIDATEQFYRESLPQIVFREELSARYGRNFMNSSDPKIGSDYIIMRLQEDSPDFDKNRKTDRDKIHVGDILFPYISFTHPSFQRIHDWFANLTITETKGALTDVSCVVDGFEFVFGTGGIHGSIESQIVESNDEWIIEDWDVASYYPNLGIKNNLYPEHLGQVFCSIYEDVYLQRKRYPKGTPENAMLKLALNATYGNSNNKFSPFYDPQYTMSITINGQLLLCMLAERLMEYPSLQMIQINTDGLTVRYPRVNQQWVHDICRWWENLTQLDLEVEEYSKMYIRDVNSYIGVYANGKIKRKGAYGSVVGSNKGAGELDWSQNHSALVVPKAAEAALLHGRDIRQFVESHSDPFDFMLRTKVPRSSRLVGVDYHDNDIPLPNVSRYFISVMGLDLVKVMPPTPDQLAKDPCAPDRRIGINTGWKATICNDMATVDDQEIEFEFYVREAEKLVTPLRRKK